MADQFDTWRAERKTPTPPEQRNHREYAFDKIGGYYRMEAARTKPDFPVMIYTDPDKAINPTGATIIQIGGRVLNTVENERDCYEFQAKGWLDCAAVTLAEYQVAMETGRWPGDGKAAKHLTEAEKADIIPDTPAEQGGNMASRADIAAALKDMAEQIGAEDPFYDQVKTKIEAALDKVGDLGKIDTLDKATKAAEIIETLTSVGRQGEARRKSDKEPWDAGALAIQNKWVPVLQPASKSIELLKKAIRQFQDDEVARLNREEQERQTKERERIAEENRQRIAAEQEEAARIAANRGEPEPEPMSEEDIAAEAQQRAAEQVEETAVPVQAPVVRSQFGRAVSSRTKKVGVITDKAKFIASLDGQADFNEWLKDKANKLARAGTALDGMKIEAQ